MSGLLALLTALPSARANDETFAPAAEPLALEEVLRGTLANNTELKVAATDVKSAKAAVLAASEPFDSAIGVTVTGSQAYQFGPPTDRPMATLVRQLIVGAGWSRRLGSGVVITPEVTTTRTRYNLNPPPEDINQAAVRLKLLVPLLRDRGGAISTAPQRAARADHATSVLDEAHTADQLMLRAATAYWDYLAARRRLEVIASSEERAKRTATETAALVKADERTRADFTQANGYYATRRAARIVAEQELVAAWQQIAVLTGMVREDLSLLPRAVTDFPGAGPAPTDESPHRWTQQAIARRTDLAAAERSLVSTDVRLQAARNELRSRFDLELAGGYTAERRGGQIGQSLDPLYRDIPGLDASISVRYELPVERTGRRGRFAQAAAAHEQQGLMRAELERRIRIGVATAFEMIKRSRLGLREAEEAVRLLQQTVDSEKRKFQVGSSTLFAVIQAEESLTSALFARIAGQRAFAVALATVRFETGTVFDEPVATRLPASGSAVSSRLTSLP